MDLPKKFKEKFSEFSDIEKYERYFGSPAYKGLRLNTLKCNESVLNKAFGNLSRVPFCDNGYYVSNDVKLGRHPLHHAGGIYIQEPSAMSAAAVLNASEGEKILDLCAAPGGKSTQIACALKGKGLLVSNEYVKSRASVLASNIERCGVKNAVVTNMHPETLCSEFLSYFDKVIVDAPCSGEGMFRKEPGAAAQWSERLAGDCAKRQLAILNSAAKAVKGGGELVYSTCTFSPEENELCIEKFLDANQDFELVDCGVDFGESISLKISIDTQLCRRIFPWNGGEGHFVAKMLKKTDYCGDKKTIAFCENKLFAEFWQEVFETAPPLNITERNSSIYIVPETMPELDRMNVVRAGVLAGTVRKGRFVPEHNLFTAFKPAKLMDFDFDDTYLKSFLKGMEIPCDKKGYTGVSVNGVMTGYGKASGGMLKNHYPKGLRDY